MDINGKIENMGTEETFVEKGEVIKKITLNEEFIQSKLQEQEEKVEIIKIEILDTISDKIKVLLTGELIKTLEEKNVVLNFDRDNVEYNISAKEFTIDEIASQMGINPDELKSITVDVQISKINSEKEKLFREEAWKNNANLIATPVEFNILTYAIGKDEKEKEIYVNKFKEYVDRIIKLPRGVEFKKITTGIVFNEDGTYTHVPTIVFEKDGELYAKINSMTNSSYSVISNPIVVKNIENHWSENIVNDMASRLVIQNHENFNPDKLITRGEFTDYMVRALGLYRNNVKLDNLFLDVMPETNFATSIAIAKEWNLVNGYPNENFKSEDIITKEEAMIIYSNAMKVISYDNKMNIKSEVFDDFSEIKAWEKEDIVKVIEDGSFNRENLTSINLKNEMTHAESINEIRNLLIKANLINEK